MDSYEYEGETVIAVGINDVGAYFIETRGVTDTGYARYSWPNMKLTAGMMTVTVEEVCSIFGVEHPGQVAVNPRRS